MPAPLKTPRSRWIAAAAAALIQDGPNGLRVESLATALGVTKGGFYAHFAGRAELVEELLDDWQRRSTDAVLAQVAADEGDPRARIRDAGLLTFSPELVPLDLAIRAWSRTDAEVRARLRIVDNARMDYLRAQFGSFISDPDEIEARSILAFTFAIGRYFLAADHGDRSRREALDLAGERLLFAGAGQ